MSALSLPYDISNNTDADAVEVEANFNGVETFVNTQVIRSDGVVAMTGQLQLVGDPVGQNDAVRKSYVDAILPIGVMLPYTGTAAPAGEWALCNGASLSTTAYPELFAVVGYKFGGGSGTFDLPNTRGAFMVGVSGSSPFSQVGTLSLTRSDGTDRKDAVLVKHTHPVTGTTNLAHGHADTFGTNTTGSGHGHTVKSSRSIWTQTGSGTADDGMDSTPGTTQSGSQFETQPLDTSSGTHTHGVTGGVTDLPTTNKALASGLATDSTTPAGVTDGGNKNLPPYIVVEYIIRIG